MAQPRHLCGGVAPCRHGSPVSKSAKRRLGRNQTRGKMRHSAVQNIPCGHNQWNCCATEIHIRLAALQRPSTLQIRLIPFNTVQEYDDSKASGKLCKHAPSRQTNTAQRSIFWGQDQGFPWAAQCITTAHACAITAPFELSIAHSCSTAYGPPHHPVRNEEDKCAKSISIIERHHKGCCPATGNYAP